MAVSHSNASSTQASRQAGGASQAPSPDAAFRQALEQQISEAIKPVLDDFRQQMAQGLIQPPAGGASGSGEPQREAGAASAEASHRGQNGREAPSPGATPGQAEARAEVPVKNVARAAQRGASAPLGQALQGVEHLGAQWLQSVLVSGLGALLAESTRAAVQQRAEQGLHTLLQKLFDTVPSGTTTQNMQRKTERTLQLILRDTLDAVFSEHVRDAVRQGGQQTIEQSLRGEMGGALRKIQEMLQVLVLALGEVLRRHQQTIVRLLLAFALLALENSLLQPEQAK